ncbi:uncharacterized protein LOC129293595 [Prosopis cineraria]|uniref:uncharacterized protein LOC129293595 n=1 Tax=Prosopis cineraria TaxID=364024 RepID=UPI00240F6E06|nr:uncharacterized protein LOC129293595 [Prosopis cineraria]
MEKEEEDRRREAAIASTPCLQPNFISRGLTSEQLSKFQELHKRRLQIKSKSKIQTKGKDGTKTSKGNSFSIQHFEVSNVDSKEPSLLNYEGFDSKKKSSLEQDNVSMDCLSKKRQKLHWGLDTKERWERKSNM